MVLTENNRKQELKSPIDRYQKLWVGGTFTIKSISHKTSTVLLNVDKRPQFLLFLNVWIKYTLQWWRNTIRRGTPLILFIRINCVYFCRRKLNNLIIHYSSLDKLRRWNFLNHLISCRNTVCKSSDVVNGSTSLKASNLTFWKMLANEKELIIILDYKVWPIARLEEHQILMRIVTDRYICK